jgi:beta-lactam-binding protein with PASTA domain
VVAQRPRSGTTVKRRRGVVLVVSAGRGETRPRRYAL